MKILKYKKQYAMMLTKKELDHLLGIVDLGLQHAFLANGPYFKDYKICNKWIFGSETRKEIEKIKYKKRY